MSHSFAWRWLRAQGQSDDGMLVRVHRAMLCHMKLQALSKVEQKHLLEYKYVAPELSLLERHGLDTLWTAVASRVYPRWLAPNVITLSGGACIGAAIVLTLASSPRLEGTAPLWVYATNAGLLLCYQTLDGSDGKQARRTKSGSPLGELMDHGVDAWTTGGIVAVCLDAFAFGIHSPWPWLILVGAQAAFFASNLTLLHQGRMRVDDVGVIELQTAMAACLATTAVASPAIWTVRAPFLGGYEARQLLGAGVVASMAGAVGQCVYEAACSTPSPQPAATQQAGFIFGVAQSAVVRQCGILAVYVGCVGVSFTCLVRQESGGSALRLLLLSANSCFAEFMSRLLVKRVTGRPLPTIPPSMCALLGFTAAAYTGVRSIRSCIVLAGVAAVAHCSYFVWATRACADALGIHVLRVKGAKSWCAL